MTDNWLSRDPFDDIFDRFFSSGGLRQPQVQRVDLSRLLNDDAKQLVSEARKAATEWGSAELTPEHLLYAATLNDPTRGVISGLGLDPDAVAEQMRSLAGDEGEGSDGEQVTLSPATKRA